MPGKSTVKSTAGSVRPVAKSTVKPVAKSMVKPAATQTPKPAVVRQTAVAARAMVARIRRRPRYRYSLTSIDDMFFRVREPIAVQRAADRRARRGNVCAVFVLVALIVGIGIGSAYGVVALLSGLNEWLV